MLIPAPAPQLSSLHSLSSHYFLLPAQFLPHGGVRPPLRRGDLAIRMGGGPRTFPGGVSKWQWKRMQAKKARQLLKARLARERQLYEMRKRAELRDAVAHLERPWDPDAAAVAPNLLSVAADDQLRALADRFHRPGGVDLWNDRDGPRVFASPANGAASARFFPKNAVHSVQPYARIGAPPARGSAADLLLGRGDGGVRGVRENADEEEPYGNREPAEELMERDGTCEPVNALDDSTADDDDDTGDVGPRAVPFRRNGSDDDRGWSGDAWFSDPEGAMEGHREQRWQERSSGASPRKRPGGRRNGWNTAVGNRVSQRGRAGAGSFSDSEVIHAGSEPKWRTRKMDDIRNGSGRWNSPREDWIGDELKSNSGSEAERGSKLEREKYSASTRDGESPRRYTRTNNGDGRYGFRGGFARDLEAPTWKPRRTNRARNNGDDGGGNNTSGKFRRGDNRDARRLHENTTNTNRDDGRRMGRNGGRRLSGDEYSLRPTSELHNSWRETGLDGL